MADFNTLIADIEAAIYENTEQAITGDALQDILLEMVTDINTAKADQGDLDDLAGVVAGKADNFSVAEPLALVNGVLQLHYSGHGIQLEADGYLGIEAGNGLTFVDSTLVVYEGRGIVTSEQGALEAFLGDGMAFDPNGAIVPDFAFVQAAISDLATIRSGAAAGATAVQPADVSDCVRSASVSTIVTLSQAEYDALAIKDANTFYVII